MYISICYWGFEDYKDYTTQKKNCQVLIKAFTDISNIDIARFQTQYKTIQDILYA